MTNKRNLKIISLREEEYARMNEETIPEKGMPIEVIQEAIEHLLNNYDETKDPRCELDFVFMIGRGHYGTERSSGDEFDIDESVLLGNAHQCSHSMAKLMLGDPQFCSMILHAVEVYSHAMMKRRGGGVMYKIPFHFFRTLPILN